LPYALFLVLFLLSSVSAKANSQPNFNAESFVNDTAEAKIERVNQFFNSKFEYRDENYDYWLQKEAFIAQGGGDCEDFALSKYQALLESGLPAEDFHFVYALHKGTGQHHIALRHTPTDKLLDNLTSDTRSVRHREDLTVLFEFTATRFFPSELRRLTRSQHSTLLRWQKHIQRAQIHVTGK